ncbi:MAG: VWA domain-containing protein [Phycisphaerales bacterium]|nr:VWA domain-containing protein [Phycisphaerales bacterium]
MTFLSPTAGLIGAALTLPPLLLFYMLKLRRRPVRVSTTMLWEQAATDLQANTPFRWLRTSWLLLLHLVILACLLTALARPVLDAPAAKARQVLLVLDTSASMNARDGADGRTRLEDAKARALDLARTLGARSGGIEVGVISAAWNATLERTPGAYSGEVARAIEAVQATDQRGRLQPALDLAESLVRAEADEEAAADDTPLVVILTDASTAEHLALSGAQTRIEQVGGEPGDAGAHNAGIVALAARRDFRDPELVRIFVRVANAEARERSLGLRIELGAQTILVPLTIPAARLESAGSIGGRWKPGERSTSVELRSWPGGVLRASLEGADLLASDDRASVVLRAPKPPSVVLVREEGATRAGVILEEIVRALAGEGARVMSGTEFDALARSGADLAGDVVIFNALSPATTPREPSLSFGASIADLALSPGPENGGTDALWWDREHPALRASPLDALFAARPMEVSAPDWTAIARGSAGPLLLERTAPGPRRLAAAFDLDQSTWPLHFSFPIFIASSVEYLAGAEARERGASFSTFEPARATALRPGMVRALGPAGDAAGAGQATNELEDVALGVIRTAGEYRLENASDEWLSVNLCDAAETACATGLGLSVSGVEIAAERARIARRMEAWPWFVLVAGVLLMVEWIVYGAKMRVR